MSVSGIGPKAALSIMSVTTPEQFAMAVITNDVKTITKAQGVGPKVAQRVILELRDKLKTTDALPEDIKTAKLEDDNNRQEAIGALVVLGYTQTDAKKAVMSITEDFNVEILIKEALKLLTKQVL